MWPFKKKKEKVIDEVTDEAISEEINELFNEPINDTTAELLNRAEIIAPSNKHLTIKEILDA